MTSSGAAGEGDRQFRCINNDDEARLQQAKRHLAVPGSDSPAETGGRAVVLICGLL